MLLHGKKDSKTQEKKMDPKFIASARDFLEKHFSIPKHLISDSIDKRKEWTWARKDTREVLAETSGAFPLHWFLHIFRLLSSSSIRYKVGIAYTSDPKFHIDELYRYTSGQLYATLLIMLMAMEFEHTCSILAPNGEGRADLFARIRWPFSVPTNSSVYANVKRVTEKISGNRTRANQYFLFDVVSTYQREYIFGDVPWVKSGADIEYISCYSDCKESDRVAHESELRVMLSLEGMRMRIGGKQLYVVKKSSGRVVVVNETDSSAVDVDEILRNQTNAAFYILPKDDDLKKLKTAMRGKFRGVKDVYIDDQDGTLSVRKTRRLTGPIIEGGQIVSEPAVFRHALKDLPLREKKDKEGKEDKGGCGIM